MTYILQISKKQLETLGDLSITGLLYEQGVPYQSSVRIEFEEFNTTQTIKNGGRDWVLIPEYVIGAICRNLLYLQEKGYQIEIGSYST